MATTMPVLRLHQAQEETLRSTGFVVKNCFIDEVSPVGAPLGRGLSAPPALRGSRRVRSVRLASESGLEGGAAKEVVEHSDADGASTRAPVSPCATMRHGASTSPTGACSERGQSESGQDEVVDIPAAVEALQREIMTRCGFLRIVGASYCPKASKKLAMGSLTFFVAGLPGSRRFRWLMPLRLSAAKVLESCGYTYQVSVGTLFVSDRSGEFKVKVDFAPALFSS